MPPPTYYYKVTALAATGAESVSSSVASATTPALGVPTQMSASAGDQQVTLTWESVAHAERYKVEVTDTSTNQVQTILTDEGSTTALVAGLINGVEYSFTVRATNDGGDGEPCAAVNATPSGSAPDAPADLTAVAGDRQVTLTWSPAAGARLYKIYRAVGETVGDGDFSPLPNGLGNRVGQTGHHSFVDHNLQNGTTYHYKVSAVDAQPLESVLSDDAYGTTLTLDAPQNLTATAGIGEVRLNWDAVQRAERYVVYRRDAAGGANTLIAEVLGTSYIYNRAPLNTNYYYVVHAWNSGGESADSNEVSAMVARPYVDALIRTDGGSYTGDGIYNSDAQGQAVAQNTGVGSAAIYRVKVENACTQACDATTYTVQGPAGGNGWMVKYYSGLSTAAADEITADVTGNGWPALAVGVAQELTVTVTPDATVVDGASYAATVTTTVTGDTSKADTVKATTTRVRQVGSLQYSTDGGNTWLDVPSDRNVRLPVNTHAQFRALLNPASETWPDLQPVWTGAAPGITGTGPTTSIVIFDTVGDYTVQATCDNSLTANVHIVGVSKLQYKRASDSTWQEFGTNPLVVVQGDTLNFQAVANPDNAAWPDQQPGWSGTAQASDNHDGTASKTFDDTGDFVVTATCGSRATGQISVVRAVDVQIRTAVEEDTAFGTHKAQTVVPGVQAEYVIRLTNHQTPPVHPPGDGDGEGGGSGPPDINEYYRVSADLSTGGSNQGWTVQFLDDEAATPDITSDVTGTGATFTIPGGTTTEPGVKLLRLLVTGATSLPDGALKDIHVNVVPTTDPRRTGNVEATTTRLQQLDHIEYSLDRGNTWVAVDSSNDADHPLSMPSKQIVAFRAIRKHRGLPWPGPQYPTWDNSGYVLYGDVVWLQWDTASTQVRTVTVACGDTCTAYITAGAAAP
jgi:fibronectin type 3 domain-containing protein